MRSAELAEAEFMFRYESGAPADVRDALGIRAVRMVAEWAGHQATSAPGPA
ncbi:hypothetical protein [Micromonospora sp. NPDC005220]|uniref:hypothetical protein n=1 Tax=Micromonospora sp. NPDC005220 TaxID=3155589 RepID=UPI0033A7C9E8